MGGGGQMGKGTYAMGRVLASVHARKLGGRGSNFCHFGAYALTE